ncbi:MAG: helix-turn-helix domain-containing protein [Jatrophihabitans sp.]|uniref:helix-turn-helix domain-containing protein n=1 Tax=Jatrophihabitans sp. TaxID=1932789 RepID=UPI003F817050
METDPNGRLYTTQEAAARLHISYHWLKKQVQVGKVRHIRFGRSVRFTEEHIHEIIAAHERRVVRAKTTARTKL